MKALILFIDLRFLVGYKLAQYSPLLVATSTLAMTEIRPGKLDLLLLISKLKDYGVGMVGGHYSLLFHHSMIMRYWELGACAEPVPH